MKRVPENTQEQKAETLWANFSSDKEGSFWKQYETLLSGIKYPLPIIDSPAVVPQTNVILQKISPGLFFYFGWLLLMLLGGLGTYIGCMGFIEEEMYLDLLLIKKGAFWLVVIMVFFLLVMFGISFILPISKIVQARTFAVSKSGLFIFNPLTPQNKLYLEWENIQEMRLIVTTDENNKTDSYSLSITTSNQGTKTFDYPMNLHKHKFFVRFAEQKNVKVIPGLTY